MDSCEDKLQENYQDESVTECIGKPGDRSYDTNFDTICKNLARYDVSYCAYYAFFGFRCLFA